MPGVTRKRAFTMAQEYLQKHPLDNCGGIREVLSINELGAREPCIYGFPAETLHDYWLGYAEQAVGLHSSKVLLISKATGEIVYAGPANDEG